MKDLTIDSIIHVINSFEIFSIDHNQINQSLPDLGMDSIIFIQLIVALEEHFNCEIPDDKLLITELDTVNKIYITIKSLKDENN